MSLALIINTKKFYQNITAKLQRTQTPKENYGSKLKSPELDEISVDQFMKIPH